jgi:hypothetical protein
MSPSTCNSLKNQLQNTSLSEKKILKKVLTSLLLKSKKNEHRNTTFKHQSIGKNHNFMGLHE